MVNHALKPVDRSKKLTRKRTEAQTLADASFIEDLALKGKTLKKIAEELRKVRPYSLSYVQVWKDLEKMRAIWLRSAQADVGQHIAKELAGLEKQEDELWQAWVRSQQHAVEWVKERGKGRYLVKVKETVRPQVGDSQFMALILRVRERRCQLLGLDRPTSVEVSGPGGTPIQTVIYLPQKEQPQAPEVTLPAKEDNGG